MSVQMCRSVGRNHNMFKLSHKYAIVLSCILTTITTRPIFAEPSDTDSIERGRYLVKITGCNDCHTAGYSTSEGQTPEDQWLMGDPDGWEGPWGTTFGINLRLYVQEKTEEQWLEIAKTEKMLPPMPWFNLRATTEADLQVMYRFIKSLGPAGEPMPEYIPPTTAAPHWNHPYTGIYVFGDSLSDTGHSPLKKFSNGDMWVQYLAENLNLTYNPEDNFAYAGALTDNTNKLGNFPGLQTQVDQYLANHATADPQALYVVWAGANDLLADLSTPDKIAQVIATAVTNIVTAVTKLQQHGAKNLIVLNLPDLGKTPRALSQGASDTLTTISTHFNQSLATALQPLSVIQINIFASLEALIDPQANLSFTHLTHLTEVCVNQQTVCDNPDEYVFWDDIHPTSVIHRVLASIIEIALVEPYYVDSAQDTLAVESWAYLPLIEVTQETSKQILLNTRLFHDPHDRRYHFEVTYSNAHLFKSFQDLVTLPTTKSMVYPTFDAVTGQLHVPVIQVKGVEDSITKYKADLASVLDVTSLLFAPTTFRLTHAQELTP